MCQRVAELDDPEKVVNVLSGDDDAVAFAFFYNLAGDFATDVANFTLQVTDAGFARVVAN